MTNIQIGIGGDLTGLRGRLSGRSYEGNFEEQFVHLKELIGSYDASASIDFIECRPPEHSPEEFGQVALKHAMPVRQFSFSCDVDGLHSRLFSIQALRENLELARRTGTIDRISLQVQGNNERPSIEDLVDFYIEAESVARDYGIDLYSETHVDRFTYDPRRLVAVHESLSNRTGGVLGLRVNADFSHYIHQLGNSHFCNSEDIAAGRLKIDPLDPTNYVTQNIISAGLVGMGHLRVAIPNNLTRTEGTIQYPVVDPKLDPDTAHLPYGGMKCAWNAGPLKSWLGWYREVFSYQLSRPERPVARFSSEYIGDGKPGYYGVDQYRNLFQNIAMVSMAHGMIREVQSALAQHA